MRNTYLNAQMGPITQYSQHDLEGKTRKLKWIDSERDDKDKLRTNVSEDDLCLKEEVDPITAHKQPGPGGIIKVPQDKNMFTEGT